MYVYGHILINWSGIFKVKVADIKIKKGKRQIQVCTAKVFKKLEKHLFPVNIL